MIIKSKSKKIPLLVFITTFLSLGISGCGAGNNQQTNPGQGQAVVVQLKTIEPAIISDSSEYVGTLAAKSKVSLAPRTEGRILEIYARQGDRVSQGEPIVRLEPTQEQENVNAATQGVNAEKARLGQAQAEVRTAEANRAAAAAEVERVKADSEDAAAEVELAKINIERTRKLVEGGALAQQVLDNDNQQLKSTIARLNSGREALNAARESLLASDKQVEQAIANIDSQNATIKQAEAELASISQNLEFNTINAPIDGVVGSFDQKKVGDYVNIGDELTTITDNQSLELNINIPVEYRDRLKPGLAVETINKDGSTGIAGEIAYIAPLVQQNTQSILTKVVFPSQNSLRDREYVRVRVIWDEKPGVLVPTTAVSTLGGQNFVYIAKESDSAENNSSSSLIAQQQPIKLGSIQAQDYQVVSGLKKGDKIAVSNILSLRDGAPIKLAEEEQAVSNAETEAEQ